jgi:hypothetical protein
MMIDGEIQVIAGMLNLKYLQELSSKLGRAGNSIAVDDNFLLKMSDIKYQNYRVRPKSPKTRIRIFPDRKSLTNICIGPSSTIVASGTVNMNGEDWYVFMQTPQKNKAKIFSPVSDFHRLDAPQ